MRFVGVYQGELKEFLEDFRDSEDYEGPPRGLERLWYKEGAGIFFKIEGTSQALEQYKKCHPRASGPAKPPVNSHIFRMFPVFDGSDFSEIPDQLLYHQGLFDVENLQRCYVVVCRWLVRPAKDDWNEPMPYYTEGSGRVWPSNIGGYEGLVKAIHSEGFEKRLESIHKELNWLRNQISHHWLIIPENENEGDELRVGIKKICDALETGMVELLEGEGFVGGILCSHCQGFSEGELDLGYFECSLCGKLVCGECISDCENLDMSGDCCGSVPCLNCRLQCHCENEGCKGCIIVSHVEAEDGIPEHDETACYNCLGRHLEKDN